MPGGLQRYPLPPAFVQHLLGAVSSCGAAGPAIAATDGPTARVSKVALSRARLQYEALLLTAEGRAAAAAEPGLGLGPAELESASQV